MQHTSLKRSVLFCIALSWAASAQSGTTPAPRTAISPLPVTSETVFRAATQDPNVLFYLGEQAYLAGRYNEALSHFIEASKYEHAGAVKNAKHMISQKMVTESTEQSVIDFLLYQAGPGKNGDVLSLSLLGQYFEGSACLWQVCDKKQYRQGAFIDYAKSYFFHEQAAQSGDLRSAYTVGMMDLLGIGTSKNPALALERFEKMAENGFVDGAYLSGRILQGVSGIIPQPDRAMAFFKQAADRKHSGAMMALAELRYRDGAHNSDTQLMDEAVSLYEAVIDGAFASHEERVAAQIALANILNSYPNHHSKKTPLALMNEVASATVLNESVVRANIYLGDLHSDSNLNSALQYYTKASELLFKLPVVAQQRNADVFQKLAALYAKGDASLDRSELQYGRFMTTYRGVMAKTPEPEDSGVGYFQGYYVFTYPGA